MLYAIFSCITASVAVTSVLFFVFLLLSTSEYTGMDNVGGWVSCRTCTDTITYTVYNGNGINNTVVVAVVFFFFCFFLLLSTSEYTGMDTVGCWVSCRTCMDTIVTMGMVLIILVHIPPSSLVLCSPSQEERWWDLLTHDTQGQLPPSSPLFLYSIKHKSTNYTIVSTAAHSAGVYRAGQ